MKPTRACEVFSKASFAVAALAGVLAACSLGLPSEDAYFRGSDADGHEGGTLTAEGSVDGSGGADSSAAPGSADGGAEVDGTVSDPGTGDGSSQAESAAASPDAAKTFIASALDGAGEAGADPAAFDAASLGPAVLQLYYSFDDDDAGAADGGATESGAPLGGVQVVADKSGNLFDGTLNGATLPTIDPAGHTGQGLKLDGTQSQYVVLPAKAVAGLDSMSVTCWINLRIASIWARLFDFNAGSTVWVYFSPTGWNDATHQPGTRFAISSGRALDPEMQLTTTVPLGGWHHVAIVLAHPYLLYYEDGVEKYRTIRMTLGPKDLVTTQHWIGRSAYATDPYLSATIDEFRIYSGGLTPQEVAQLAAP